MAYDATHGYTVQEATNLQVYKDYKCQILTLSGTTPQESADWSDEKAKEVLLFSASAAADDDGVTLNIKTGGSYGDNIVIAHDNLPFTVKGLLIDQIKLTGGGGDDDAITVLSFH